MIPIVIVFIFYLVILYGGAEEIKGLSEEKEVEKFINKYTVRTIMVRYITFNFFFHALDAKIYDNYSLHSKITAQF